MDVAAAMAILEKLPQKTTELICHPIHSNSFSTWQYGQGDLDALLSPEFKKKIAEEKIEIIGFKEL